MKRHLSVIFPAAIALSACVETTTTTTTVQKDPITAAISGKILVAPRQRITAYKDGRLIGKAGENLDIDVIGTWEIRDGKWCRTLSAPADFAGTECQDIMLNGDSTVTIVGRNGPGTLRIE